MSDESKEIIPSELILFKERFDFIKRLIKAGDKNYINNMISYAAHYGYLDVVQYGYGVAQGGNVQQDNNFAAVGAAINGHLEILKYLESQGADIHVEDEDPLRCAISGGHLETVQYLISQGADVHINREEFLIISATIGCYEIFDFLLSKGADLGVASEEAQRVGAVEAISYLQRRQEELQIKKEVQELKAVSTPMEPRVKVRL